MKELSFVITARNDDYGGNLLNRIKTSLRVLKELVTCHEILTEVILVEYNPSPDVPSLFEALAITSNEYFVFKVVVVPNSFHQRFNTKIPFLEYIAKNIGIRRATKDFVLVANPDVILSKELILALKNTPLKKENFYRANRNDISLVFFAETLSVDQILTLCKKKVDKILYNKGTFFISYKLWFLNLWQSRDLKRVWYCPIFKKSNQKRVNSHLNELHENAAGDFLMMHKDLWYRVRGYDERPLSSFFDGYILYVLYCYDYVQEVLKEPIYHINHTIGKAGRQELSLQKYKGDRRKMKETKIPYTTLSESWGYPNERFTELQ